MTPREEWRTDTPDVGQVIQFHDSDIPHTYVGRGQGWFKFEFRDTILHMHCRSLPPWKAVTGGVMDKLVALLRRTLCAVDALEFTANCRGDFSTASNWANLANDIRNAIGDGNGQEVSKAKPIGTAPQDDQQAAQVCRPGPEDQVVRRDVVPVDPLV